MALSNELISQFVKITNDKEQKKTETTVYGTIKWSDGKAYVQIDGSTLYTPISTTAEVKDGDRVTVMIKDHSAVVTGNMTSPSASKGTVDKVQNDLSGQINEFGIIVADKVSTEQLDAVKANINTLTTNNLEVLEKFTAVEGEFEVLKAKNAEFDKVTIDVLDVTFLEVDGELVAKSAKIESLEATDAEFRTVTADYADFKKATVENLEANDATIKNLEADVADVKELSAKHATIEQLNATNANIENLNADVGKIDTLIFGTASGDVIQSTFANAVIAQLGNAQIKSAMIDSVSASKIQAGDILTNNIRVMSEDGRLLISDETIQISDATRVRVQIGKDAAGDYSISIWDADGKLMFSEGGITDNAIKNAIIRNDMVSDTANISAHKLDINSLFEEINGSSKTIKSSKIYLDDKSQTLDVAFTAMSTELSDLEIGGRNLIINGEYAEPIDRDTYLVCDPTSSKNWSQDLILTDNMWFAQFGSDIVLEAGQTYTFSIVVEKVSDDDVPINLHLGCGTEGSYNRDLFAWNVNNIPFGTKISTTYTVTESNISGYPYFAWRLRNEQRETTIRYKDVKLEKGNKATDWTSAPEDVSGDIADAKSAADSADSRVAAAESVIHQLADSLTALVERGDTGSLIRQDADGLWYIDISDINDRISGTADELSDLSGLVLDANGEIDLLKTTAKALSDRTNYVRSYTDDNGQPCLELGEGDSVFKVRITNTDIRFMADSAVPAWMSRDRLVIEKAMVKTEFQFGDDTTVDDGVWVWKRRSNGNLGLSWKAIEPIEFYPLSSYSGYDMD